MSKFIKFVCIIFALMLCLTFASCRSSQKTDLWKDALYTEDKAFGSGAKSFDITVAAEEKSVSFTVSTDKENLADALLEHKLIEGDKGPYGIYIKKVNGITADYDVTKSYWAIEKDGEPLMTGASDTPVDGGEHFEFIYTK